MTTYTHLYTSQQSAVVRTHSMLNAILLNAWKLHFNDTINETLWWSIHYYRWTHMRFTLLNSYNNNIWYCLDYWESICGVKQTRIVQVLQQGRWPHISYAINSCVSSEKRLANSQTSLTTVFFGTIFQLQKKYSLWRQRALLYPEHHNKGSNVTDSFFYI